MQVLALILGFVARRLFIDNLPIDLLGVSDFFNSFFYSVSLVDIGFASILIYNLYKPINENDEERVKWLVGAFKKIYIIIALIIIGISIAVMPLIYSVFKIDYDNKNKNDKIILASHIIRFFTFFCNNTTKQFSELNYLNIVI